MKIQVLRNYGGERTREQRIPPGVYDADDPRLFGQANYLVENGHALVVEPDVSESAAPDVAALIGATTNVITALTVTASGSGLTTQDGSKNGDDKDAAGGNETDAPPPETDAAETAPTEDAAGGNETDAPPPKRRSLKK